MAFSVVALPALEASVVMGLRASKRTVRRGVCFEIADPTKTSHGVAHDHHPKPAEPVLKALGPDSPTPAQLNLDSPLHGLEEGKLEHGLVSKESGQWHQVEVHELELAQLLCCELVSTLASVHLKSLSSMMVLLMVA